LVVSFDDSYVVTEADRGARINYAVAFEHTWEVCFDPIIGVGLSPPVMVEEKASPTPSSSPSAQSTANAGRSGEGEAPVPAQSPSALPSPSPSPPAPPTETPPAGGGGSIGVTPPADAPVGPADVAVSARAVKAKVKAGVKPKVRVAIAADAAVPVGTVVVSWGGTAKTVKITPSAKGKATVTLPRLSKGRHAIDVAFFDTTGAFEAAAAKRFPITVR
jgi:hypothetical protein